MSEESSEVGISSLMDTWLLLRAVESANERNRILYILKSRGMAHSNQMREFFITDNGIHLRDVYVGSGAVLTGSARLVQEARDRAQMAAATEEFERRQREMELERIAVESQIANLRERLDGLSSDLAIARTNEKKQQSQLMKEAKELASSRKAD
jgi:circadian clock protein KaiC